MSPRTVKEVSTPYLVDPEDEALGRDTIVIRRNGEAVAVIMPYAEYTALTAGHYTATFESAATDPDFERDRAAFRRLLSELLKTHRGEWVAIVDEQAVEFGADFSSVIRRTRERFGQRPVYVQQILETPHIYKIGAPRIVR